MDTIEQERWRAAGVVFHEVVDLDELVRADRLAHIGAGDPALRSAVEALLAGDAVADERLPHPGFGIDLSPPKRREPLHLEGRIIGRFRVLECIGRGGMGVVYRAEDTGLAREVALKFPLLDRDLSHEARARIVAEARAAGALDHPNLCPIYEIGDSDAGPFFAMPFYRGETLKQRLARAGALPVDESVAILTRLAAGLASAHAAGIVHRDIKPGNVMLGSDGGVRLLDFGLARVGATHASSAEGTLGTVSYMAPEQIRGERVDARADLWSLGVMLYEMLANTRPFTGDSEPAIVHAILHAEPTPLGAIAPATPPALAALVAALLAKDPAARPRSADDLSLSLAAIAAASDGDARSLLDANQRRRVRVKRRATIAAAIVLLTAALASGAIWWRHASTLIGRGQLAPRDALVLADFDVAGSDTLLGPALTLLFRRGFDAFTPLRVMTRGDVGGALRRMRRPANSRITPDVAREVAAREGARAVVTGEVRPLGAGYLVSVQLLAVPGGGVLASAQADAPNPERDLVPAVSRLGETLRQRIGFPLREAPAQRVLHRRVTTTSLAAIRLAYFAFRLPPSEGIAAVREAIALDSTFAYAWMVLGNQISALQTRSAAQDSAYTRAYLLRDQLTQMERAQTSATYWDNVWRDRVRGRAVLETALSQDTTIWRAVPLNIADALVASRQFEQAEAFARRIEAWPDIGSIVLPTLVNAQAGEGKYAAAESTLARLRTHLGTEDPIYVASARALAVNEMRYDAADSILAHASRARIPDRFGGLHAQVRLLRLRGRIREARRSQASFDSLRMSIAAASGARFVPAAGRLLDQAREELWLHDDPLRARASLDSILSVLGTVRDIDDRLVLAAGAALQAAAGRPSVARTMLDRANRGADTIARRALYENTHTALGEIALAEGRYREAMEQFRASDDGPDALPSTACSACALAPLARVAEQAGWADSARVLWERYLSEPAIERLDCDQWFLATAYARLADAYASRGDAVAAARYRGRFTQLRKNPDPDVAAQFRAVRAIAAARR